MKHITPIVAEHRDPGAIDFIVASSVVAVGLLSVLMSLASYAHLV